MTPHRPPPAGRVMNKRTRVEHDDEPEWTVLDWKILHAQMEHIHRFWDARLKLSYAEREKIPTTTDEKMP